MQFFEYVGDKVSCWICAWCGFRCDRCSGGVDCWAMCVADVVDARHIAAMVLWRAGLHIRQIADAMGVTRRYVQYIVTDFEARVGSRRHVRRMYELVWNHVRNGLEMMAS